MRLNSKMMLPCIFVPLGMTKLCFPNSSMEKKETTGKRDFPKFIKQNNVQLSTSHSNMKELLYDACRMFDIVYPDENIDQAWKIFEVSSPG